MTSGDRALLPEIGRRLPFDDLANDAIAGIDLLASRSDIDAKRIGLHGHREGGIIAPMVLAIVYE
jgi:cephalosporin-C deacetylase-like acetyl esterase